MPWTPPPDGVDDEGGCQFLRKNARYSSARFVDELIKKCADNPSRQTVVQYSAKA